MSKVYDCFMFFNELDLLEVRLNELYDTVDKFVLVEATKTHTNQDKPLWFEENKDRYSKFLDKIHHIAIKDYPEYEGAWSYENHQRNVMMSALKDLCQGEDVVLISDLDEIPRAETVKKHKNSDRIKVLEQGQYTFYFNYLNATEPLWHKGTRMIKFKNIGNKSLTDIRFSEGKHIKNGGWHFNYLGGIEKIKYKIQSVAHQEYNNAYYLNEKRLEKLIKTGVDIFERGYKYKIVNLDKNFPVYIRQNKKKYEHLILKKPPLLHSITNACVNPKQYDKRYIDTHTPINDNPVDDFISLTSTKVIEVTPDLDLEAMPDNHYDCAVLDNTLTQLADPEQSLIKLRQKLNRNGYVVMTVANFRYIKNLNQIVFKKIFKPKKEHLRFFTRKTLFDLINQTGYYIITFKGLKPDKSIDYKIKNALMFGNLYDAEHKEFLCVIKG